ncbi:MAG: MBL fold metallo-hydrolase [Chloroflexi bacterium]|nr:MAG: MBL fold metallo-hydrolase [Chloroflexota bacterium]
MSEVHEIADGIYRISHFDGNHAPVEFSQFLIKDERPLLFHTGAKALFPDTLEAVKKVLDPASLSYISWSHLESDECGALNDFLSVARNAQPVHGQIGIMLSIDDFFDRPVRGFGDNEVLDLGEKKLRFLITPHVPHAWDAILVFEETTRALFCSDLFTVFGKPQPITESDVVEQSATYRLARTRALCSIGLSAWNRSCWQVTTAPPTTETRCRRFRTCAASYSSSPAWPSRRTLRDRTRSRRRPSLTDSLDDGEDLL